MLFSESTRLRRAARSGKRRRDRHEREALAVERLDPRQVLAAAAVPTISIAAASATEGDLTSTAMVFTITLSEATRKGARVFYNTTAGTAAGNGVDFYNASGVAYVRPNATTTTIRVLIRGDRVAEPSETFTVSLSRAVNCTIAGGSATGTILDNDQPSSTAPVAPAFAINVVFPDNSLSASQRRVFSDAAARWSEIIVGDLPDFRDPATGRVIDDMEIMAVGEDIDGPGRILGQAGPTGVRAGARGLPYSGIMLFDTADLQSMEQDRTLQGVIMHEMGHVLGFGTLWENFRLVTGLGTANPVFRGANAAREYNAIFGVTGTTVPVEAGGGPGTAGGHWRESVMLTELMTGFAEPAGVPMPISRITIGSLQDMGYTVNYAAADAYIRPAGAAAPVSGPPSAAARRAQAAAGARPLLSALAARDRAFAADAALQAAGFQADQSTSEGSGGRRVRRASA